jgi:hypothetical protein
MINSYQENNRFFRLKIIEQGTCFPQRNATAPFPPLDVFG